MHLGATQLFLDANILYSRTLRDWFCVIAGSAAPGDLAFRVSEAVLSETLYHLRKDHPTLSEGQVEGTRTRILSALGESSIVTGFDVLERHTGCLADVHDAHVLAAAELARVDYLVAADAGFAAAADLFEFEIYDPDSMLCLIADRNPAAVLAALRRQVDYQQRWQMQHPDLPKRSLQDRLEAAGAPEFAHRVKSALRRLAMTGQY